MVRYDEMQVTHFTHRKTRHETTFSADFIFSRPFGGKRAKLWFWLRWVSIALANPLHILKFGVTVRRTVWFSIPSRSVTPTTLTAVPNAFFLLAVPLAIATNEDLVFDGAIHNSLLLKSPHVQKFYAEIAQRRIKITAKKQHNPIRQYKKAGLFFTLGVDSFYSLLCHPAPTTRQKNLIYVDGYDVPFYQKRFLNQLHKNISIVAKKTGTSSITIATNLRDMSDLVIGWGRYHATALVAVGTLLEYSHLMISGESFDSPDWGLRNGVDTLYTTQSQRVELIGHGVTREQKMRSILTKPYSKIFLRYVRVCWENVRDNSLPYNCSQCQKCIKTKLTLQSLGVTDTPTFLPVQLETLKKLQLVAHVAPEWHELYTHLKKQPKTSQQLLTALRYVLNKPLRT